METMWKLSLTFIVAGVTFIPLVASAGKAKGTKATYELYENITVKLHAHVTFKCKATKDTSDNLTPNFIDYIEDVSFTDEGWYTCNESPEDYSQSRGGFFLHVTSSELTLQIIVIVCISVAVALIIIVIAAICLIRKCKRTAQPEIFERIAQKKVAIRNPTIDEINSASILPVPQIRVQKQPKPIPSEPQQAVPSPNQVVVEYDIPYDSKYEFPRNKLLIDKVINEGVFNRIYVAHVNVHQRKLKRTVAVKTLKTKYTDADLVNLLCEIEIMKMIGTHPNIINLIGCCSQTMPLFMIIEYAAHGNLRDYLRGEYEASTLENRDDCFTSKELTEFVMQAGEGMKYLTMKKVNSH